MVIASRGGRAGTMVGNAGAFRAAHPIRKLPVASTANRRRERSRAARQFVQTARSASRAPGPCAARPEAAALAMGHVGRRDGRVVRRGRGTAAGGGGVSRVASSPIARPSARRRFAAMDSGLRAPELAAGNRLREALASTNENSGEGRSRQRLAS